MYDGHQIDALSIAFSKVFDKVSHGLLTRKLNHYSFCGCTNKWIEPFLTGRSQSGFVLEGNFLTVRKFFLAFHKIRYSGHAYLFFYINDLPESSVSNGVMLCTDDTIAYLTILVDS